MKSLKHSLIGKEFKTLSPLERKIVDKLLEYDDLEFESNYSVSNFMIDIAFSKYKIGLEIDGHKYHSSEEQKAKDELRQEYLESKGWEIERVPGWFCYRYPKITIAKVLRYIPELQTHPLFLEGCEEAKQWYARDLLNEGYTKEAIKVLNG